MIEQQSKVVVESFIVVVVIAAGITFPNREQTFNLVLFDFIYKIKNEWIEKLVKRIGLIAIILPSI